MTPDDVLIEAISVASRNGDSPQLREIYSLKLRNSIREFAIYYVPSAFNDQATNRT